MRLHGGRLLAPPTFYNSDICWTFLDPAGEKLGRPLPFSTAVKSFRSASRLGAAAAVRSSSQTMDVNTDLPRPHLIGDCLIQIFTLLNEEDLIIASSVCRVSRVPLCGSS